MKAQLTKHLNILRQRFYDWRHHVDTWRPILLDELEIPSENLAHGIRYDPTTPSRFRRIMQCLAELEPSLERFTFVDLGSGKGRALLLASEYSFRRIIGVEFAPQLVDAAERNIASYRSSQAKGCRDIQLVCEDAAHYELPEGPLVVYLYNPFRERVMREVLAGIERAARSQIVYVVYSLPVLRILLCAQPFLELIRQERDFCLFRAHAAD